MYWNHSQPPKKTRNQMNVPYYILVNDEDKDHIKYYHNYLYGRTPYKIAKERNIPYYNLKIVRVTKCNTFQKD